MRVLAAMAGAAVVGMTVTAGFVAAAVWLQGALAGLCGSHADLGCCLTFCCAG